VGVVITNVTSIDGMVVNRCQSSNGQFHAHVYHHKSRGCLDCSVGLGELCLKLPMPAIPRHVIVMFPEEAVLCSHYAHICNGI